MTWFCEQLCLLLGPLSNAIYRQWHHSLSHMYVICPTFMPTSQSHSLKLSSVDAPVAHIHGRSCNFPLIHPMEVLLAGHWVTHPTTVLLWHHPTFTPLGSWLTCGWSWCICPMHGGHLHTKECQPLMWHEKKPVSVDNASLSTLVHHSVGGDVHCNLMHHLACFLFPPIPNLPLSLKGISLHWDQIARLQVHGAYLLVIVPFFSLGFSCQLGLSLLKGGPQLVMNSSHIFIHTFGRGLSCGGLFALLKVGK